MKSHSYQFRGLQAGEREWERWTRLITILHRFVQPSDIAVSNHHTTPFSDSLFNTVVPAGGCGSFALCGSCIIHQYSVTFNTVPSCACMHRILIQNSMNYLFDRKEGCFYKGLASDGRSNIWLIVCQPISEDKNFNTQLPSRLTF